MSFSFSLRAVLSCVFTVELADSRGASSELLLLAPRPARIAPAIELDIEPVGIDMGAALPGVYSHMSDPAAPTAAADATATVALMLPLLLLLLVPNEMGVASGSCVELLSACAGSVAPEPSVQRRRELLESLKSDSYLYTYIDQTKPTSLFIL